MTAAQQILLSLNPFVVQPAPVPVKAKPAAKPARKAAKAKRKS